MAHVCCNDHEDLREHSRCSSYHEWEDMELIIEFFQCKTKEFVVGKMDVLHIESCKPGPSLEGRDNLRKCEGV